MFALILAHVRRDYWYEKEDTIAFQTAQKFLDGGKCEHGDDWGEWRDMIIQSLGMEVEGFVKAVKAGRRK